ncbi:thioredoxin family protein [Thioalkalivibrio denitrificans]|uniref:Thioredoxin family protein n=1 Tax=Thioalkalivibrio denitrificans TaxID=108003 RepID=A0A1V3NUF0_9GAMM|nr:HEAT repeat domain-containing protein [Thioalkalivibrio denitrificans]OOG28747.1 thioredoxin family protein [Thioalkalivibrio denitrificans]
MSESRQSQQAPVRALLLVAPGCPHCPTVLEGLATLVKDGTLGRLEVVNIAVESEPAATLGVRSVPWARIGAFELAGLHSPEELRHWAELAGREEGMTIYLADLMATGRRDQAGALLRKDPSLMHHLAALLGDTDSELSVRIGVMATLEELQEEGALEGQAPLFAPLTAHANARVRADACHALTLIGGPDALAALEARVTDPDPEVRETALDGVEALKGTN